MFNRGERLREKYAPTLFELFSKKDNGQIIIEGNEIDPDTDNLNKIQGTARNGLKTFQLIPTQNRSGKYYLRNIIMVKGVDKEEAITKAKQLLNKVNLEGTSDVYRRKLSWAQQDN